MGKKKIRAKRRGVSGFPGRDVWLSALLAFIVIAAISGALFYQRHQLQKTIAALAAWDPAWPALPQSRFLYRALDEVRAAYAFAARRPDVMEYLPCYCGCEREGHRSVHDCFVRERDSTGPTEWASLEASVWTSRVTRCSQRTKAYPSKKSAGISKPAMHRNMAPERRRRNHRG